MIQIVKLFRQSLPAALSLLTILLAVLQPCPNPVGARVFVDAEMVHLFSFTHPSGTYVFGLEPCLENTIEAGQVVCGTNNKAASWWRINDDPGTGFTPAVREAKMSNEYEAVTPFTLKDHPYIFGLHRAKGDYNANIWRINDDAKGFDLKLYKGKMSTNYVHVVSFQLRGQPYILGLHEKVGANIWSIKEGPKGLTWALVKYKEKMSPNYQHLKVFYMKGHPYIFGVHAVGANIWRVKDDPSQGLDLVLYGAKFPKAYNYVLPFYAGDRPYLLGVASKNYYKEQVEIIQPMLQEGGSVANLIDTVLDIAGTGAVEWGKGYGCIWQIAGEAKSLSIKRISSKCVPISHRYTKMTAFEQAGKTYLFGVHEEQYANIWRVNDDPATGFALVYYGRNK